MSEVTDSVLAAVDGGARDTAAIEEATGLEKQQIYAAVHTLKKSGALVKGENGLERGEGTGAVKEQRATSPAAESSSPTISKKAPLARKVKAKRATGKRLGKKAVAAPVPSKIAAAVPAIAFTRFGEYVVLKRSDLLDFFSVIDRLRVAL